MDRETGRRNFGGFTSRGGGGGGVKKVVEMVARWWVYFTWVVRLGWGTGAGF